MMTTVDMPPMVALDALSTDQSSRALGCAQGARYGCPKAAASSLEQIVCTKAPFFTHPKDFCSFFRRFFAVFSILTSSGEGHQKTWGRLRNGP